MSQQKITAHHLLDLSAAFDTIDHSILVHRLSSWFGQKGPVLSCLQSYLSLRNFIININKTSSAPFPLHQSVPQGAVLRRLLFILYTTLLNSLISDSSDKHHLYADDSQLLRISCKMFLTWKLLSTLSVHGWQPIFSHSISLILNF